WGRIIATHLVNGTGTAQPTGILTGITAGKTGATGQTTTVIYDDLVDLSHSVDPAYRQLGRCVFLMNDTTRGAIAKLKDGYGRPLFVPSVTAGETDTILGYRVVVDQAMPNMAANAT